MTKGNKSTDSPRAQKNNTSNSARDFPLPPWLRNAKAGSIRSCNPVRSHTKTLGAYKAGANGVYVFRFLDLKTKQAGSLVTATKAVVIEGKKIMVGLAYEKAGMGSRPHHHPNDQFNLVLKGTLRVRISNEPEMLVPAGSVVYFPANVVHSSGATADEDVIFYVCKDLSWDSSGIPVDKSISGPQTGFAAVKRRSWA